MNVFIRIYLLLGRAGKICFWSALVLTLVAALSSILAPVFLSKLVGSLSSQNEFKWSLGFVCLFIGCIITSKIASVLLDASQSYLRVSLLKDISSSYLDMILKQPPEDLKDKNSGYVCHLLTEASNDIYILMRSFASGILIPFMQLLFALAICLYSGYIFVSCVFITFFAIYFLSNLLANKKIAILRVKMIDSSIASYMCLSDSVQNMLAIKKNGAIQTIKERYNTTLDEEKKSQEKFWKKNISLLAFNSAQSIILFSILFSYSAFETFNGQLSIASLILIVSYISLFADPVESLSNTLADIKRSLVNLERFFLSYKDNQENDIKEALFDTPISISIKDLSYRYSDAESNAIEHLNADIKANSITSIRAESGKGKTTIAKILSGQITDFTGSVIFNNIDISSIPSSQLSDLVYHVTQDDFIFMDKIKFNLLVANRNASETELFEALKLACIDEIQGEKLSLDFEMQDTGDNFSGGQKKRISLARLFLRNPSVIILDEATNSLDNENKRQVIENIKKTFPSATIIIISHDKDLWKLSDSVIDI